MAVNMLSSPLLNRLYHEAASCLSVIQVILDLTDPQRYVRSAATKSSACGMCSESITYGPPESESQQSYLKDKFRKSVDCLRDSVSECHTLRHEADAELRRLSKKLVSYITACETLGESITQELEKRTPASGELAPWNTDCGLAMKGVVLSGLMGSVRDCTSLDHLRALLEMAYSAVVGRLPKDKTPETATLKAFEPACEAVCGCVQEVAMLRETWESYRQDGAGRFHDQLMGATLLRLTYHLKRANGLFPAVAQTIRSLHNKPPEAIAGIPGPSYHDIGISLANTAVWRVATTVALGREILDVLSGPDISATELRDLLHNRREQVLAKFCVDRAILPPGIWNSWRQALDGLPAIDAGTLIAWIKHEAARGAAVAPPKDQGGGDDREEYYLPAKKIKDIFFLTSKKLQVFLEAHPNIKQKRPLSRKGTPNPQRLNLHILDFIKAIRSDDLIAGNPAVARRIENNLQRAQLAKQIEDAAIAMFLGK